MLAAIAAAVILAAYFMGGETADGFDCVARKFQLRADVC